MTGQINTLPLNDITRSLRSEGVATGSLNANLYRIFPGFSGINQEENETNFNYQLTPGRSPHGEPAWMDCATGLYLVA